VPDIVPRRRTLLASAAALPLLLATAGCRSSEVFAGPDPLAGPPPLGHDVLTLQAVIAAEGNLIDLYRAAINGDPATSARTRLLQPLLAQHEQHLAQLRARLIEPPGAARGAGGNGGTGSPSPGGTGAGGNGGTGSPSPGGASPRVTGAVSTARLRAAERASAASLVQRLATVEPALAQLFASIAASDATHATALGG
jgi:hypothetical protein